MDRPPTSRSRIALLVASSAIVVLLMGGGLALGVGSENGSHRQVVLFAEVLSLVTENYVDPVDRDELLRGAYEGMLGGLDPLGAYLTPTEVSAWKKSPSGRHVGPGLGVLKSSGSLVVVAVAEDSPAAAAGIEPGDHIRRVEDVSLRDISLAQARRLLEGEAGTSVRLSVLRPSKGFRREELTVARAARRDAPFALTVDRGVAVLALRDLSRVPERALVEQLQDVREGGAERLLVDLRDVADASVKDGARVAALFAEGEQLVLKDRAGRVVETVRSERRAPAWSGPIGVLVNGATAGGAEAVAVLLRAQRGAEVYGEQTHGLGAEPKLLELQDGSGVLISAYVWETPSGSRWNDDGLSPDTRVAATGPAREEHAQQLSRALDLFVKKPVGENARKAA